MTPEELGEKYEANPGKHFCFKCGTRIEESQKIAACELTGFPVCGFCMALWLVRGESEKRPFF